MKRRKLEIASFIVQGLYSILCVGLIILCLVYRSNFDGNFGRTAALSALELLGVLFFAPALPVGAVLNICALHKRRVEGVPCKRWIVWTITSPILCVLLWMIACFTFVAITGGV